MFRGQSLGRLWIPLVALESLLATRREVLGSLWSRHTWAAWAALVRPLKIFKFLIMYLKIIPIEQVLSHLISTWEASIIFTCNFKHTNFELAPEGVILDPKSSKMIPAFNILSLLERKRITRSLSCKYSPLTGASYWAIETFPGCNRLEGFRGFANEKNLLVANLGSKHMFLFWVWAFEVFQNTPKVKSDESWVKIHSIKSQFEPSGAYVTQHAHYNYT